MYQNGWSTLREWPRSLPMRDRFFGVAGVLGLAEVLLVQALPLPLLILFRTTAVPRWLSACRQCWSLPGSVSWSAHVRPTIVRPSPTGCHRCLIYRRPACFWRAPFADVLRGEAVFSLAEVPNDQDRLLFAGHLMALAFGLGGLLIALPHPELWAGSPMAARVFSFGMTYAGSLHILLGAATMLAFGVLFLGLRRTLIFFVTTVCFSLSAELIGTGTGWPFGNYAYTSGLGFKVLGRVPFTIPLSWFLVGFSAYLLGTVLAGTRFSRHRTVAAIAVGAYLLTVWDLVLDPAMASPDLPIKFWNWFESGPYYGMPIQNFAGWTLTGVLFMTVSRLLWRHDASPREFPAWVPLGVYLANMGFAIALSLSVRIWEPVIAAILLGCIPALLAWRSQRDLAPRSTVREGQARPSSVSQNVMRLLARAVIGRKLTLTVEGLRTCQNPGRSCSSAVTTTISTTGARWWRRRDAHSTFWSDSIGSRADRCASSWSGSARPPSGQHCCAQTTPDVTPANPPTDQKRRLAISCGPCESRSTCSGLVTRWWSSPRDTRSSSQVTRKRAVPTNSFNFVMAFCAWWNRHSVMDPRCRLSRSA